MDPLSRWLTPMVVGRGPWFLTGFWQRSLLGFSLGVFECPHNMSVGFSERETEIEEERIRMNPHIFMT